MRGIAVVSKGVETSRNITKQLRQLLGESVKVEPFCIDIGFREDFKDMLVVITSHLIKGFILGKMHKDASYVVCRRSINYNELSKLISIPAGTEVLLVNDVEQTCNDTIQQLIGLGIDHIVYHPYYLGMENYKQLELAVTPGETHLAPGCVRNIIDIGTRLLDITTLIEILLALNMMEEKGELISSQYIRNIVELLKKYNEAANQSTELKNMFETIVENSSDAIAYYDAEGKISVVNEVFTTLVGYDKDYLESRNIKEILPELTDWKDDEIYRDILKIHGRNLVSANIPIKRDNIISGYVATMKDVTEIQEIEHELRRKLRKQEHNATYRFKDILAESRNMQKTIELAKKLASSSSTVLIQGESGTGKEFFAQAIHNLSKRKAGPFVPVNFAALPMNLLESELFGYEDGAFTGAKKGGKQGLFEEAHGGTIFLDEIGDSPLELQARLLRVLQEKEVRRVGGTKRIPIDVRVIAATNRNLLQLVSEGLFRQDLFFRINVLNLYLPPLRERKEDIPLLLQSYLRRLSDNTTADIISFFSKETLDFLTYYKWAGNVRELVNIVEYLLHIKERHRLIEIPDLPAYIIQEQATPSAVQRQVCNSDLLWVLKKISENNRIGRRTLAELAYQEGRRITEARARQLLAELEGLGLVSVGKGGAGTIITPLGEVKIAEMG